MSKLKAHFARANAALDRVETETGRDVDKFVARTEEFHKRREQVFRKKHEGLDAEVAALAEFEQDLTEFDGKNDLPDAGEQAPGAEGWTPKPNREVEH